MQITQAHVQLQVCVRVCVCAWHADFVHTQTHTHTDTSMHACKPCIESWAQSSRAKPNSAFVWCPWPRVSHKLQPTPTPTPTHTHTASASSPTQRRLQTGRLKVDNKLKIEIRMKRINWNKNLPVYAFVVRLLRLARHVVIVVQQAKCDFPNSKNICRTAKTTTNKI